MSDLSIKNQLIRNLKWSVFTLLFFATLASCDNAQPLSWETEIALPLIDDNINWTSYVEDSLLVIGEGGEAARLIYSGPFEVFAAQDVPLLPDTTLDNTFSMGNDQPIAIPVPVDFPFMNITNEMQVTNLGGLNGAYMRELIISEGQMTFTVESTVDGILEMNYTLPSVTINGVTVGIDVDVPASVGGVPGSATQTIDIGGAVFDMTGVDGSGTNIITSSFSAMNSPLNANVFYITNLDSLTIKVEMLNMRIQAVKGYLGNYSGDYSLDVALIDTVPIPNPILDLTGAVLRLRLNNTLGADLRMRFDTLEFDNMPVVHPSFYGVHDIARAIWNNEVLVSSNTFELDLGEPGSNVFDLIELFPHNLHIGGGVELNPFGDVSLGNDYVNLDYIPELELEIEIPLKMGMDGIALVDSFTIDPIDIPQFDGNLIVNLTSTFPITLVANIQYFINDGLGTIEGVNATLNPGFAFPTTPTLSQVLIPITQSSLIYGGELHVEILVRTDGAQVFTGYENLRVQIGIEGTQLVEL